MDTKFVWEVTRAEFATETLYNFLDDGWEPFAVHDGKVYLKRVYAQNVIE